MFARFTNTQAAADMIKQMIDFPTRTIRMRRALGRFERADWHPAAFYEALASSPGRFGLVDGRLVYEGEGEAIDAATRLLETYLALTGDQPDEVATGDTLTLRQAADIVGCDVSTLKKAIKLGDLIAEHVAGPGNGYWQVQRADLDAWAEKYHRPREGQPGRKPGWERTRK